MERAMLLAPLLLWAILVCCHGADLGGVESSDVRALRGFAAAISDDPNGALQSWRDEADVCGSWAGVKCSWIHSARKFRVVALRLPRSLLQGELSSALGLLSELRALDLSGNRLSGRIPGEIARLSKLRFVDLSHNHLAGAIPRGKSLRNRAAFAGNPGLCGWPLERECPSSIQEFPGSKKSGHSRRSLLQADAPAAPPVAAAPSPSQSRSRISSAPSPSPSRSPLRAHKRRSKLKKWGIGAAFGVLAGSVLGILVGLIARAGITIYKRRRAQKGPIIFHHKINPKMLEFLNTPESFQQMDVLGSGGAGKVYKAVLENGLSVAIKRIPILPPEPTSASDGSKSSGKGSFGRRHTVAEMETLGKIRHVNLAWLYAYILKPDAHLLLYQFMPRGSLQDVMAKVREGALQLEWSTRRRIAIGIVRGLKYLHYDCSPKILHRDLKTSNILLDENLEAHLGDFGLAKALPDDMTHVTTQVAGTIGYIAPEYHQTCKFTVSSDVYSMGIVLAVLVSGKEPTDDCFKEFAGGIVPWMCYLVQTGQEVKGIDPSLLVLKEEDGGGDAGEARYGNAEEIAEMKRAMRIACLCTKPSPGDRPSTKDVLVMLDPPKLDNVRPMEDLIKE